MNSESHWALRRSENPQRSSVNDVNCCACRSSWHIVYTARRGSAMITGVGDGEVDVEAFVAAAAYMAGIEVAERQAFDVDLHCAGHVADNSGEEFAPGCQVHVFDLFFEARGA